MEGTKEVSEPCAGSNGMEVEQEEEAEEGRRGMEAAWLMF